MSWEFSGNFLQIFPEISEKVTVTYRKISTGKSRNFQAINFMER